MRSITLLLVALPALAAGIDPAADLILRWPAPDQQMAALARQVGARAVVLPAGATEAAKGLKQSGIAAIAEVEGGQVPAGFDGIAYPASGSESEVRAFAARHAGLVQFVYLNEDQVGWRVEPAHAVLRAGQWPGVRPRDAGKAGASETPWVDANSYYVAYLRGLFPNRPALLGYRPDEQAGVRPDRVLPYDTLEMAVAEAVAAGGNVILTIPQDYRKALVSGDARAAKAWASLGATWRFLSQRTAAYQSPLATRVAVAAGSLEQYGELLNMLYRRNVAPAVFAPDTLPPYSGGGYRILVASGIGSPARKRALAFAMAGGCLMAAPGENEKPWWADEAHKTAGKDDFDFYSIGKGKVIGYREPIIDPAEFALDVIDAEGWSARDVRLYSGEAIVAIPYRLAGGKLSVELINYGHVADFLVRVEGRYRKASYFTPEDATGDTESIQRWERDERRSASASTASHRSCRITADRGGRERGWKEVPESEGHEMDWSRRQFRRHRAWPPCLIARTSACTRLSRPTRRRSSSAAPTCRIR